MKRRIYPFRFAEVAGVFAATSACRNDEVVELPPLLVVTSADKGDTTSEAGGDTRTETLVIDLPHLIKVLNNEFIPDTGSQTTFQAPRFVSNVSGGNHCGNDALARAIRFTCIRQF